jgi:two-component system chemotaxis response regulator CheB
MMFALPPQLKRGAGDQPTGIACAECPGALVVRVEGVHGHLRFTCRIGHTFGADDLLAAKERVTEDRVWAAVLGFEELAALLRDLDAHAARHDGAARTRGYPDRAARARALAFALRQLVEEDQPIRLDPDTDVVSTDSAGD